MDFEISSHDLAGRRFRPFLVVIQSIAKMQIQARPGIHALDLIGPLLVAILYISACSLIREPNRRNFNAIMMAGAGAAYLNGGFGKWEFAFTAIVTYFAYRGLHSYNFVGIGWLFHTGWDVLHHLYGNPIVPFAPTSSLGCAICDPVIAIWCFAGGPSIFGLLRKKQIRSQL